jgi:hypothetical protein
MATNECDTFFSESEEIAKKFNNLINLSRNLKSDIKEGLLECLEEFKSLINSQNSVINKQKNHINYVLQTQVDSHFSATQTLCQQIQEIKQLIGNKSHSLVKIDGNSGPKLYSTALKTKIEVINENVPKNLIIIKPKKDGMNSKQTENVIREIVIKSKLNVEINSVKNISKGGLLINCGKSEDMSKIVDKIKAKTQDIEAKIAEKKAPKIVVYDVSEDISKEEILREIVGKNQLIENYFQNQSEEQIKDELKIKFNIKRRTKNHSNNWVIEISPKLKREVLNKMERIAIGWKMCEKADYVHVIKCFKCNGFGHIARDCSQQENSCGNCGQTHKTNECDLTVNEPFCTNCEKTNRFRKTDKYSTTHTCFSKECKSLERIKNIIIAKTDYGY